MSFSFVLLLSFGLNLIILTKSQCNYVALNLKDVYELFNATSDPDMDNFIRDEELPPPLPYLLTQHYTDIPYPIDKCFRNPNDDTQSYQFVCELSNPKVRLFSDDTCSTKTRDLILSGNILSQYECGGEKSCDYVSVAEINIIDNYDQDCDEESGEEIIQYNTSYAVDVCLKDNNNNGWFKIVCNSAKMEYTIQQYNDELCVNLNDNTLSTISSDECIDINPVYPYGYNDSNITNVYSIIYECTAIDAYTLIYDNQCVSSELKILYYDNLQETNVFIPSFGPFNGYNIIGNLARLDNKCNPCNINENTCNYDEWNDNILFLDYENTFNKFNDTLTCNPQQFIDDIQLINDITPKAVVFGAENTFINYPVADPNTIPTLIVTAAFADFTIFTTYFNNINDTLNINKSFGIECNTFGYPETICMNTECKDNELCEYTQFAGQYIVQSNTFNDNPQWKKSSYAGINEDFYIRLQPVINDPVSLQWVITNDSGTVFFYNPVKDNGGTNFNISNFKWITVDGANTTQNKTISPLISNPYYCEELNINVYPDDFFCVSSYNDVISAYMGSYYELGQNSFIYLHNDTNQSILTKAYAYNSSGDYYTDIDDDIITNIDIFKWVLYDPNNDNRIIARCDVNLNDEQAVEHCINWYIWNNDQQIYIKDNSFDVDAIACGMDDDDNDINIDSFENSLCLELNNKEHDMYYSQSQYLWGLYVLIADKLYDNRPYYQNYRLQNDEMYDTYLIWYDPKDSWILITEPMFNSNITEQIFNNIPGYCNQQVDKPIDCNNGWYISSNNIATDGDYYDHINDTTRLYLIDADADADADTDTNSTISPTQSPTTMDPTEEPSQSPTMEPTSINQTSDVFPIFSTDIFMTLDSTPSPTSLNEYDLKCHNGSGLLRNSLIFESSPEIKDICVTFGCVDDPEGDSADSEDYCNEPQIPDEFIKDDCGDNNETSFECEEEIDANAIYKELSTADEADERSTWIYYGNDVEITIEYDDILRFWIWSNSADDNESWCLKWESNTPIDCIEFWYESSENELVVTNTSIKDCTIIEDNSADVAADIVLYLILACLGCALFVFILGYYKQYAEKHHEKKVKRRQSRIANELQMSKNVGSSSPLNTTAIQEEEEDDDDDDNENDKLNTNTNTNDDQKEEQL